MSNGQIKICHMNQFNAHISHTIYKDHVIYRCADIKNVKNEGELFAG